MHADVPVPGSQNHHHRLAGHNTRCMGIFDTAASPLSGTYSRDVNTVVTLSNCHRWTCACTKGGLAIGRRLFHSKQEGLARHKDKALYPCFELCTMCDASSRSTLSRISQGVFYQVQSLPEQHPAQMLQLCHGLILGQL